MIVDTSAILAIAFEEPAAPAIWATVAAQVTLRISAANLLETWMVLDRRGTERSRDFARRFLERLAPLVEPVTAEQITIARDAWQRFGRGSGHAARLNYGDLFAYALARHLDEPLLFVGDDFARTDIEPAMETG